MTRRPLPVARIAGLAASGLTAAQVIDRRQQHGPNAILEVPPNRWVDLARDTSRDPMIWFLVAVGAVYGVIGQIVEAVALLAAIVPLIGMDAFLHWRTQASTEGLRGRLAASARVVREGTEVAVPAVDVVPGDLAIVSAGETFPADGVLLEGDTVQVDEAPLTGEAFPAVKRALTAPLQDGDEPAVPSEHWGFAGTRVLTGPALLRVVFTGEETVYGQIVRSAVAGARGQTPLQGAIQTLVSTLIVAATVLCLILAIVRVTQGYGWVDALVSAVTLASAALPEEFPVVFTFFLGVGVYRLARRQALVRRAVSVENIGRVSVICSDKTGTITEGQLRVTRLLPVDGTPNRDLLHVASLASRGERGDPLDAAILRAAEGAGALEPQPEQLATFPFTEGRRRETAVVRMPDGVIRSITKGATETVLAMTRLPDAQRERWAAAAAALAEAGHKVIACAWRRIADAGLTPREAEAGYELVGLVAFEDPVREGVIAALEACRDAGIHVIMVTGDHPLTARSVARAIGLGGESPRVMSGDELEVWVARGDRRALRQVDVIARAAPGQKLTLVRALQEQGEIVVATGDGVNDVPALQAADVGIAMGERGTRSAREVAAIVLLDDAFQTIVGAIAEGRQLFRNLQLSFQYLLMIHFPLVISAALVPLAGYPLLYLPIHIVWLELIIHPTALLAFQDIPHGEGLAGVWRRQPKRFFGLRDWVTIALVGSLTTVLVVAGYVWSVSELGNAEHGRAMALATLTLVSAIVTAELSGLRAWPSRVISAGAIALSAVLIQAPGLSQLLHLEPLHIVDWTGAAVGSLIVGVVPLALGGSVRRRHRARP
jgi:Ca2+-transporting ATPase